MDRMEEKEKEVRQKKSKQNRDKGNETTHHLLLNESVGNASDNEMNNTVSSVLLKQKL